MSWSTSVPATPAAEFGAAIEAAQLPDYGGPAYSAEVHEQLAAAKMAAMVIFASSAAGTEGYFAASLSGHANAGHKPTPGWANDSVSVSVYQVPAPAPAEPTPAASSAASVP